MTLNSSPKGMTRAYPFQHPLSTQWWNESKRSNEKLQVFLFEQTLAKFWGDFFKQGDQGDGSFS